MHPGINRCRRFVRRARRRARVLGRSLLLHVLVVVLVVLGLLARMTESSDVQLALAQRAAALARLDASTLPPSLEPASAMRRHSLPGAATARALARDPEPAATGSNPD